MLNRMRSCGVIGAIALGACQSGSTSIAGPSATVSFVAVAPLCSGSFPVQFSIDGQLVGIDTFRIAIANPHTRSRDFSVSPGEHALGARLIGGIPWPTETVTAVASGAVADSLSLYCS